MRPKALDSYILKQLNHWLKSKNKQNMSENDVILLNTRFTPPGLKIKTITQANLLRRASTHSRSPMAEAEAKVKDKFKAFYFKLVPFVSS